MMEEIYKWGAYALLGLVSWLLANRDGRQAKEIEALTKKQEAHVDALANLKLDIAREHYIKSELDERFKSLDVTFREGFQDLGAKVDRLVHTLISHIAKESGK